MCMCMCVYSYELFELPSISNDELVDIPPPTEEFREKDLGEGMLTAESGRASSFSVRTFFL